MKKNVLPALILFIFLSNFTLFAQETRYARVYIPQISGAGEAHDKAFFHHKLAHEVVLQHYKLALTNSYSEFILSAKIIPIEEFRLMEQAALEQRALLGPVPQGVFPPLRNSSDRREFFSWDVDGKLHFFDTTGEENYIPRSSQVSGPREAILRQAGNFALSLELINTQNGSINAKSYIIYYTADDSVSSDLALVLRSMLSSLPKIEEINDWRDKWIFLELAVLWTPRIYSNEGSSLNLSNYGFKLALDVHFLSFLAFSVGGQITEDWFVISGPSERTYRDMILEIPFALKFVIKSMDRFMLEPYGGISLNTALMNNIEPSPFSWFAGFQLGLKMGPGMALLDTRFSQDMADSKVKPDIAFTRSMVQIGVGYKFGILQKRPQVRY